MTPLPATFQPGPYDVICAKGKNARNHEGNKFFRKLIQDALPIYGQATSKFEKSMIVSEVIDEVRSRCNVDGGFVKPDGNGGYMEVGDHLAREKVGQSLRDGLASKYKSSARSKKRRQKIVSVGVANEFDSIIRRHSMVTRRMSTLRKTAQASVQQQIMHGGITDEEESQIDSIFLQANLDILEAFKKNDTLLQQFSESEYTHKIRGTRTTRNSLRCSLRCPAA